MANLMSAMMELMQLTLNGKSFADKIFFVKNVGLGIGQEAGHFKTYFSLILGLMLLILLCKIILCLILLMEVSVSEVNNV